MKHREVKRASPANPSCFSRLLLDPSVLPDYNTLMTCEYDMVPVFLSTLLLYSLCLCSTGVNIQG